MSIDLRKHFGLWERCGNTPFWMELENPSYRHVFVNPIDGVMITAQEYPHQGGPALRVHVRDASGVEEGDIKRGYDSDYPWVKKVMSGFFAGLFYVRAGVIKGTPQQFFAKHYKDQTREYMDTGKGHSEETGKDEILEATKRVISSLGPKAVVLEKVILKDEIDELLEEYGILEC
jgi:hypothetical protein